MRNIKSLLIIATALSINGCSSITSASYQSENQDNSLAELTAYRLDSGFIAIETIGYGCTFQQDFKVVTVSDEDNMIEIIRTRKDNCKMTPRHVALSYSFKHLNLDNSKPIKVLNRVSLPSNHHLAVR